MLVTSRQWIVVSKSSWVEPGPSPVRAVQCRIVLYTDTKNIHTTVNIFYSLTFRLEYASENDSSYKTFLSQSFTNNLHKTSFIYINDLDLIQSNHIFYLINYQLSENSGQFQIK